MAVCVYRGPNIIHLKLIAISLIFSNMIIFKAILTLAL